MRVYLMQHGVAASKDVDPERRLTDKGREDGVRMSVFLKPYGLKCDAIYHSGKARALETAKLISRGFDFAGDIEAKDGIAPLDPVGPVAEWLDSLKGDIALVGHLPFMGKLVSKMVSGDEDSGAVSFKPGTIVCMEKEEAGWSIAWMIRPGFA